MHGQWWATQIDSNTDNDPQHYKCIENKILCFGGPLPMHQVSIKTDGMDDATMSKCVIKHIISKRIPWSWSSYLERCMKQNLIGLDASEYILAEYSSVSLKVKFASTDA